jgi:hypothetical protein
MHEDELYASLYVPISHKLQKELPPKEYFPAVQDSQSEYCAPLKSLNFPGSQFKQLVPSLYFPFSQTMHDVPCGILPKGQGIP